MRFVMEWLKTYYISELYDEGSQKMPQRYKYFLLLIDCQRLIKSGKEKNSRKGISSIHKSPFKIKKIIKK